MPNLQVSVLDNKTTIQYLKDLNSDVIQILYIFILALHYRYCFVTGKILIIIILVVAHAAGSCYSSISRPSFGASKHVKRTGTLFPSPVRTNAIHRPPAAT